VWIEGIQSDPNNRGFDKKQLGRIMHKLQNVRLSTGCKVEWLWLDTIAIPTGGKTGNLQEEIFKTEIINSLATIYRNADVVVIFDALTLQLHPRNLLDVAVALLCGRWMTRVWTYQEIKLAKEAYIITATHVCSFNEIVTTLEALAEKNDAQFNQLYKTFARLQRRDDLGISLPDIALSCQDRETGNEIDYARAFFPVLEMKWLPHWSREEGMRTIYRSQRFNSHVGWLAEMHGSPRLSESVGWAPSYLTGLEGVVNSGRVWGDQGLRGDWYSVIVVDMAEVGINDGKRVFNITVSDNNLSRSMFRCILSRNELPEAITGVRACIAAQTALILCTNPFNQHNGAAKEVLLARKLDATDLEAAIYCTAAVTHISALVTCHIASWLFSHFNPIYDPDGTCHSLSKSLDNRFHRTPNLLHEAVHTGNLLVLHQLLADSSANISAGDENDRTPLHYAAIYGNIGAIQALVAAGADLEP